jgi:hypothetical protein
MIKKNLGKLEVWLKYSPEFKSVWPKNLKEREGTEGRGGEREENEEFFCFWKIFPYNCQFSE